MLNLFNAAMALHCMLILKPGIYKLRCLLRFESLINVNLH